MYLLVRLTLYFYKNDHMNKLFFSYSLIYTLFSFSSSLNAQNENGNGIDGYTTIIDALKDPANTEKVWISCNSKEMKLFIDNAASFKKLNAFKIKDAASETGWDQLFNALSKCASLKEIELTFNEIKTIPASVAGLKNLEKLIIWGSTSLDYASLFKELSKLQKLKTLELNSNELSNIPSEIKTLKNLESFTITDNEGVNYPDLIEKLSVLPALNDLSLEVNSITELPSNIIKLKNLKKLNISNNYISGFPDKMQELNNLDSLQADGNLFVNYVDEFNKLKGINISYLSIDGTLTEEEKAELLKLFPKAKVDEKVNAEPPVKPIQAAVKDLFEPLVPALNVPKSNYSVDAGAGAEINYGSGTQIRIPADAFVDKDNKSVTGNINVTYREFSNPLDIAFSGIPMEYKNATLESAGMFQLEASKDGQPLFLKKGNNIEISLVTSDTAGKYNFYSMDTAKKEWVDEGKIGSIKIAKAKESQVKIYSKAWEDYRRIILENDTMLFNSRFYDSSYCHTEKYRYFFNTNRSYNRYVRMTKYKQKGNFLKKPKKEEIWFNLSNYTYSNSKNPELRAFANMVWVYEGSETPKEFSRNHLRRKRYSDLRIERSGDSFILHLKEQNAIHDIPAHPISRYKGSMEKAQKNYDRRYRNYKKALDRRERTFNRNLLQNKQRLNKNVWKNLRPRMAELEKRMTYEEWINYYEVLNGLYPDSMSRANQSLNFLSTGSSRYYRNFSVQRLGYHNFDNPLLLPVALTSLAIAKIAEPKLYANITAAYTDKEGKSIKPTYVMVIDKRVNSVSRLGAGTSMSLAILSNKNLMAVMPDGSVGLFSEDDFKNIKLRNNESYIFDLKIYKTNELEQLRKYLTY
jgi:hypothetical protein